VLLVDLQKLPWLVDYFFLHNLIRDSDGGQLQKALLFLELFHILDSPKYEYQMLF
jgi:hypothetical protein